MADLLEDAHLVGHSFGGAAALAAAARRPDAVRPPKLIEPAARTVSPLCASQARGALHVLLPSKEN